MGNANKNLNKYLDIINQNVITSATDLQGKITNVSEAFCDISGYRREELIGQNHNIVRHKDMPSEVFRELWNTIKSDETWKGEIKNRRKDGSFYWVYTTISPNYDDYDNKIGYTSIRYDITDKKKIERLAITDGLTNIYNRRYFNEIFPDYVDALKRKNEFISFMILDIDHFKQYNDTYGHQKGDDVLIRVAVTIQNALKRESDYCFRLGGEEFGVLFKSGSCDEAHKLANVIRKNIENLNIIHENNSAAKVVTASIGAICIEHYSEKGEEKIYKHADDALYQAKEAGRNRVVMA